MVSPPRVTLPRPLQNKRVTRSQTRTTLSTTAGKRLWSYDLRRKPGEGGAPKRYLAATPGALADTYSQMAAQKRNVYEVLRSRPSILNPAHSPPLCPTLTPQRNV